mgnify:FL=1
MLTEFNDCINQIYDICKENNDSDQLHKIIQRLLYIKAHMTRNSLSL